MEAMRCDAMALSYLPTPTARCGAVDGALNLDGQSVSDI